MPRYSYQARDDAGALVRGLETARDEAELDRKIAEHGLVLISARSAVGVRHKRVSRRHLIDFCYHLSVVVDAGIPLLDGLQDLAEGSEGDFAESVGGLHEMVQNGSLLSEAMAEYPRHFSPLLVSLVHAGEDTGRLDQVLRDVVAYLEWREDLRKNLVSALTYPLVLVGAMMGLGGIIVGVVLPNFLDIFIDLGVELPLQTRILIGLNEFLAQWWLAIAVALAAAGGAFWLALRFESSRLEIHRIALRLPLVGALLSMIEAARFTHNIAVLLSSGITLLRGLELTERIVQNLAWRSEIAAARARIEAGEGFAEAIGDSELMPPMVMRMIKIGESSGRLDEALERVSTFYDREVPSRIATMLGIFNTATILAMGASIALIAFGVFAPLYQMMGNLNG